MVTLYRLTMDYDLVAPDRTMHQHEVIEGIQTRKDAEQRPKQREKCNSYVKNMVYKIEPYEPTGKYVVQQINAPGIERQYDPCFMMATRAIHKLGDISRDMPSLCQVYADDDGNFYGMWVKGAGFFDVRFPKETTRPLTNEERAKFSKMQLGMYGSMSGELSYTFNLPDMRIH